MRITGRLPATLFLPVGDNTYGDWYQTSDANNRPLEFIEEPPTGEYRRILTRYDKAGREIETATYDRSTKLLSGTTFQYLQKDENGNWSEQQIWAGTDTRSFFKLRIGRSPITEIRTILNDNPQRLEGFCD
jgi:hypothetical protein